ncbi:carboxypeptidase-like regulatory domain-containing protein [Reichenbachiella versicolor]|uniref:carboxypeptidase-like regulatory domain-containing protein n=1 Tax=Reichenbachiella versicolor TaxID=1821036 RepID=UPI000D6E3AF6|nr:carboxypeptidase-like regulatory domain-containing protein [Reichenbachiella versicolor]
MNKYLQVFSFLIISFLTLSSFRANIGLLPTSLKITVLNELGNPVESAKVTLYKTKEDYKAETNPVTETMLTDEKGIVKFKNLEPIPYYVLAELDKKSNIGAGVLTNTLLEGKTNKVNTIIE